MSKFAQHLSFVFALNLAVALPSSAQSSSALKSRPIHISLVNFSAQRRQIVLGFGERLDLPLGLRVAIDSRVGAYLLIVSDINNSVDERIKIKSGDDAHILAIR